METARLQLTGVIEGPPGKTPHIGENGNWYIENTDTGKPSRGENGKDYNHSEEFTALAQDVKKNASDALSAANSAGESAESAKQAATSAGESAASASNAAGSASQAAQSAIEGAQSAQRSAASASEGAQSAADSAASALKAKDYAAAAKADAEKAKNEADRAEQTATEAVKTIQTEGTTQTGNVTTEGEKQVGLVKAEGEKHLSAVQQAAQEIIADREQIAKNKIDIAELRQSKADAIVETASGTLLNVKDSLGAFFEDFSMSGKTTQDENPTPDVPVEIVNAGEDGTIEIKITGKNILDIETATPKGWNLDIANLSNFESGRTYTITVVSLNDSSCGLFLDDHNKLVTYLNPGQSASFVMPDKSTFTKMSLCGGTATALLKDRSKVKVQIELGDKSTAYEPYKEPQTLTLQTPNGLPGLKVKTGGNYTDDTGQQWITDEIDLSREKYIQRIGKYVCTGKENIITSFKNESIIEYMFGSDEISNDSLYEDNGLSTHYIYLNVRKGGTCTIGSGRYAYIRYDIADNITPEQIKEFYRQEKNRGTPVTFYYILRTPIETDLPPETIAAFKQLHTNYPTTIVSNNADAGMELSYVADTKNYTDRKIEEAVSAQTQNLANLLSLMPLSTQAAMIETDTNNILDNMEVTKYE